MSTPAGDEARGEPASTPATRSPGTVVLARSDGAVIVYDGTGPDGTPVGHIVTAGGAAHRVAAIINLSKFNTWTPPGPDDPVRLRPIPPEEWAR